MTGKFFQLLRIVSEEAAAAMILSPPTVVKSIYGNEYKVQMILPFPFPLLLHVSAQVVRNLCNLLIYFNRKEPIPNLAFCLQ